MISIMELNKKKWRIWAILFWFILWELLARIVHQEILLVSPFEVLSILGHMVLEARTWIILSQSILRILSGFFLAFMLAGILALSSYRFKLLEQLLTPLLFTMRSIPVATFVIVVLIWVHSRYLAIVISFLMGFPIFYDHVLKGLDSLDPKLEEMALMYRIPRWSKLKGITWPQVRPYLATACTLAMGLCWKAGIAAEVIGLPKMAIGTELHEAKVFLDTGYVFAWTVLIVVLSSLLEALLRKLFRLEGDY